MAQWWTVGIEWEFTGLYSGTLHRCYTLTFIKLLLFRAEIPPRPRLRSTSKIDEKEAPIDGRWRYSGKTLPKEGNDSHTRQGLRACHYL
ncbi:hypothetical protein J6590_071706 [Homalodisca vitripennis]|nr:hypothetical protein J6590_071706 [Homalodisca vitripennis]